MAVVNELPSNPEGLPIAIAVEVNRPVSADEIRVAMGGPYATGKHRPVSEPDPARPATLPEWEACFASSRAFADDLLKAVPGAVPIHLFPQAPLPLLLFLGSRLSHRSGVSVRQFDKEKGWPTGFTTGGAAPAGAPAFFKIDGLPEERRGGRGDILLVVQVTHEVAPAALEPLRRQDGAEPLAEVRLTPVHGASHQSVRSAADAVQALHEFRSVLDRLHARFPSATRVLLALACPASLAFALGTAVNPKAHHPLVLHNYRPPHGYVAVHTIDATPPRPTASVAWTRDDHRSATAVLERVIAVHSQLKSWLKAPEQRDLTARVGGDDFVESTIAIQPSLEGSPFSFPYLDRRWTFHIDFLLALARLQKTVEPRAWDECVRAFFLHEGFHISQGLTSYRYSGIGRTGFVLEAVDYDADVVAITGCLAWRRVMEAAAIVEHGESRVISQIIDSALRMFMTFDQYVPGTPIEQMAERRLRRYLIWLLQWSRFAVFAGKAPLAALSERVFIEIGGLPIVPDSQEGYLEPNRRIRGLPGEGAIRLALYLNGRIYRREDRAWVTGMLAALSELDLDRVRQYFTAFFDEHRGLVGR